jgi:hypothetical protein
VVTGLAVEAGVYDRGRQADDTKTGDEPQQHEVGLPSASDISFKRYPRADNISGSLSAYVGADVLSPIPQPKLIDVDPRPATMTSRLWSRSPDESAGVTTNVMTGYEANISSPHARGLVGGKAVVPLPS